MIREEKELVLAVVVPCFNEEKCIEDTAKVLIEELRKLEKNKTIAKKSFLLFIDDGSEDKTWGKIEKIAKNGKTIGVKLAKNVGHQNALMAGLEVAKERADAIVSIDADLQDDERAILKMVKKYQEGAEIVFGVREERSKDRWFKRTSAKIFYKLIRKLGVKLVSDSADFRLMSKRVVLELLKYEEANLFLRGVVLELGFKTDTVSYKRRARIEGESKYTLRKMINLASDGITSFSVRPIRIVFEMGLFMTILGFLATVILGIIKIVSGGISGWVIIFGTMWLFSGMQLMAIGTVGEYVGKINLETKKRPRFIIEKIIEKQEKKNFQR